MSSPSLTPKDTRSVPLAVALTALFAVVSGWAASVHELWRDEAQAWLIARDSTLGTLLHHLRYEGHPPLWHLMLMGLQEFTSDPRIMQVFNIGLGCAMVFLFTAWAPFSRIQKALFALSYYLVYEYTAIARGYLLGLFFLFLACRAFERPGLRPFLLAAFMVLAGLTSLHAWIIAFAFWLAWVFRKERGTQETLPILAALAGLLTSLILLRPAADLGANAGWIYDFGIGKIRNHISLLFKAYAPLPPLRLHFWNQQWPDDIRLLRMVIQPLLGIALIAGSLRVFKANREALLLYGTATLGLIALFFFKSPGALRHHGFLFFAFLFAFWKLKASHRGFVPQRSRVILDRALTALLAVQVAGAGIAIAVDSGSPFSRGQAAGRFLRARGLEGALLAADWDYISSATLLELDGSPPVYFPRAERMGTFVLWDKLQNRHFSDPELVRRAQRKARESGRELVLIMDRELAGDVIAELGLVPLAQFRQSISYEELFLYSWNSEAGR